MRPFLASRRNKPPHGNGQVVKTPGQLKNQVLEYPMDKHIQAEYEKELELWLKNGWWLPHPKKELSPAKALIPLMAVSPGKQEQRKTCNGLQRAQ